MVSDMSDDEVASLIDEVTQKFTESSTAPEEPIVDEQQSTRPPNRYEQFNEYLKESVTYPTPKNEETSREEDEDEKKK